MAVTEVKNTDHRARCVACGNRLTSLEGPFVDLGSFGDEGAVERFDTPAGEKVWSHENIIVCGTCLGKAAKLLPGATDDDNRWSSQLVAAQLQATEAMALAKDLGDLVARRLDKVAPANYEEWEPDELRAELKRLGGSVGRGNHSKEKLIELIREAVA